MTSTNEVELSVERIRGPPTIDFDDITCLICTNIVWKPVACQTCETPFCSTCIIKWLSRSEDACPMRCDKFIQRSCPRFILNKLSKLQITCIYQMNGCKEVITYEALEKHETQCGYQPQQCSGCQSVISKNDLQEHETVCPLIVFTCVDCKIIYKRGDASVCHTDIICLRKQLQELRNESQGEIRRRNQELEQSQQNKQQLGELRELLNEQVTSLMTCGILANNVDVAIKRTQIKSTVEIKTLDPTRIVFDRRSHAILTERLLCSKCQTIFWNPVSCATCGKVLCKTCCPRGNTLSRMMRSFFHARSKSSNSNDCRRFEETSAPSSIMDALTALQVRCAYAPNGCEVISSYGDLEQHEIQCEFENIPCQLCRLPTSNRKNAKKHTLQECFQYMQNKNPSQIQQQFMILLNTIHDAQTDISRIQSNIDRAITRIDELDSTCVKKPTTAHT
ncbi:unnamed protein product [Rotaria socialis]|uniref:Uncharacterized protein n=1 Tax=Rotaria socialis TaxID=392032 RepID=A0A818QSR1_9BILA|nr:unnamed protein product [Rotaria socialis]CAF3570851.1 unnamed protein product [Rotaria socialis]CAF3643782.1 unnamed protein product [Rotaria socialis]CAF4103331.1 unnamed protein product [Rotaria socialis]CAF4205532.1 unnamed protein product [Rotaria socialis]